MTTTVFSPTRRHWLGLLTASAVLTVAGCSTETPVKLANLTVQDLDGNPVSLGDYAGKPVAITFWATTCPGCVAEIPHMTALYQKFASKGVQVIGLAMSYDELGQLKAMVADKHIPYTVLQDKTGAAAQAFGPVRLTPTFFVLDGKGNIRYQKIGPFDTARVDQLLTELTTG
ncbi:peroxiredoxin family protein [Halothiobacillus sp. DCM-1]|uniref:peroxiredoxin family protein n=1 Tax=Halothiobacillus sp. DCM-1 TaxID=3112558 RepID=UPI003249D9F0